MAIAVKSKYIRKAVEFDAICEKAEEDQPKAASG